MKAYKWQAYTGASGLGTEGQGRCRRPQADGLGGGAALEHGPKDDRQNHSENKAGSEDGSPQEAASKGGTGGTEDCCSSGAGDCCSSGTGNCCSTGSGDWYSTGAVTSAAQVFWQGCQLGVRSRCWPTGNQTGLAAAQWHWKQGLCGAGQQILWGTGNGGSGTFGSGGSGVLGTLIMVSGAMMTAPSCKDSTGPHEDGQASTFVR